MVGKQTQKKLTDGVFKPFIWEMRLRVNTNQHSSIKVLNYFISVKLLMCPSAREGFFLDIVLFISQNQQ